MNISNIIDKPRKAGAADLLGIDTYTKALVTFIQNCEMPTTLAIQGEWGSGKTSLLNQIRYQLCEDEGYTLEVNKEKPYYGIWVNTWQYSLMKTKEETMIGIIKGLTTEILKIVNKKHKTKTQDTLNKVAGIFGKIAAAGAKAAVNTIGVDGDSLVENLLAGSEDSGGTLLTFKKSLEEAIAKCLEEDRAAHNNNKGFIFFIDDLDRIDPPMAVEILELIKNIFEVENCIFVLAIDYEVVVKGLVPKFGPLTEKNEREFRSFFDKIIQLPFSMPISNYNVSEFLLNSLTQIGYIEDKSVKDEVKEFLSELALLSIGTNPRGLKRLINTLSLLQIIRTTETENTKAPEHELLLNFALVCVQVAYPKLYSFLLQEPNYKNWNEQTARKMRLPEITEAQQAILEGTEEFDEEWERVLFRKCQQDPYLAAKAFSISKFFNLLIDIVPKEKNIDFGEEISRVLGFSAVTSVDLALAPKPQKFAKIRFDTWSEFEKLQREKNRGASIPVLKEVHDYMIDRFKDNVYISYGPEVFTVNVKEPNSKTAVLIAYFKPGKLKITIDVAKAGDFERQLFNQVDQFTDEIKEVLDKKYNFLTIYKI